MRRSVMIWIIIASALIVAGLVVFAVAFAISGADFKGLTLQKYEANTYEIDEKFENVSIKNIVGDIAFVPSVGKECKVVINEDIKLNYSARVENGTLVIDYEDTRQWFDYINFFNFETGYIKLYLPMETYKTLQIVTSTGDVKIPSDFTFDSIKIDGGTGDVECRASSAGLTEIKLSTGDIEIENASFGALRLTVSTGEVDAEGIMCSGELYLKVSTGEAELDGINCTSFVSEGSTGHLDLSRVVATGKFDIKRSTGDVRMTRCDASELYIKTGTGNVTGSLLSEKIFITETSTGNIRVPSSVSGGRCEIKTSTGDIKIQIFGK